MKHDHNHEHAHDSNHIHTEGSGHGHAGHAQPKERSVKEFLPLVLVLGGIAVLVAAWQVWQGRFEAVEAARLFMGLFFLTFGFFKTLDWRGFMGAFAEYDIVAKKSTFYAALYPAIELVLGVLYIANLGMPFIHLATLLFMGVGSIGVAKALLDKKRIPCACLGTVVKLPMTTITLIEDVGMGLMALIMFMLML